MTARALDLQAARVVIRVRDVERDPVQGDPAGETLADTRPQDAPVDDVVGAHLAFERDRVDRLVRLDHVDAGVVVVDDRTDFLDDRPPDGVDGRRTVHPRRRRLDHRHARGPNLEAVEEIGIPECEAGVGGQGRQDLDVVARPGPRRRWSRPQACRRSGPRPSSGMTTWPRMGGVPGMRLPRSDVGDIVGNERPAEPQVAVARRVGDRDRGKPPGRFVVEARRGDRLEMLVSLEPEDGVVRPRQVVSGIDDHLIEVGAVERFREALGHRQQEAEAQIGRWLARRIDAASGRQATTRGERPAALVRVLTGARARCQG